MRMMPFQTMTDQFVLILTTLPDETSAQTMARRLVDACRAACVSVGGPVHSLYHWQGKTETSREWTLTVKTNAASYPAVEALLLESHPYELPEIIAVPITAGHAPYLAWIASSVRPDGGSVLAD
jgi:periplasmic divalent cation tolerance protein